MHGHFRNTFPYGFTVAEITELGAAKSRDDARLSLGVRKRRQPRVELS
jgi:hypothetical protein